MFKGSNVALITPFKEKKLDEESYLKLINLQKGCLVELPTYL